MIPLNNAQIEAFRTEKSKLEVEVAEKLLDFYNKRYKYGIQRVVRQLLLHILSIEPAKLNPALKHRAGAFLLFAQGVDPSWDGLNRFLEQEIFWSLGQCSDVIRLFGELNEEWGDLGTTSTHLAEQLRLRPFPTYLKPTFTTKDFEKELKKDPRYKQWGMGIGHRHRGDLPKEQWGHRGAPYLPIGSIVRGVDKFKFLERSVVGAIDHTFGLEEKGADISGTTTDSIYAMRWGAGVAGGVTKDALTAMQILPLVTMVPQGHHTMVECAHPLSRRGYIKYSIGYYSTLAPIGVASRIESLLKPFDTSKKNAHVLVWGRGQGQQGVLMDQADEIQAFKDVSGVLYAYGLCVTGGLPDVGAAMNVMKTEKSGLLARKLRDLIAGEMEKPAGTLGLSELERKFKQFKVGKWG